MSKLSQQSLSMCLSILLTLAMLVGVDQLAHTHTGAPTQALAGAEQTPSVVQRGV